MEEKIVQNQQVEFQSQPSRAWFRIALFLALGVVLVGGLVFAGIQIGKEQATRDTKQVRRMTPAQIPVVTSAPTLSPETTPFPDETAEWKTYSDTKHNYSFKYPQDWVIKNEQNGTRNVAILERISLKKVDLSQEKMSLEPEGKPKYPYYSISVKVWNENPYGDLGEPVAIGGVNGLKIVEGSAPCGPTTIAHVEYAQKTYGMEYTPCSSQENGKKFLSTYNQILSTFKFLDQSQADETINWKIYTHPSKTGETYIVKYPESWMFLEASGVEGSSVEFKSNNDIGSVSIFRSNNYYQEPVEQWMINKKYIFSLNEVQDITVGSIVGKKLIKANKNVNSVFLPFGRYLFIFTNQLSADNQKIFDQILSTFKFLDQSQADETADWKTYIFEPIRLSLKVPAKFTVHTEEPNPGNDFTGYIQNYLFNAPVPSENAYQLYVIWQKTPSITQSEFQQLRNDLNTNSVEDTVIAGFPAIKGQVKGERNRFVTFILKGNTKISLFTSEPTHVNKERTDQILSTFRFLE